MQRRPTMREVATAAGVSIKTVSRVVNNEEAVRPEVAMRVRQPSMPSATNRIIGRRSSDGAAPWTSTIGFVLVDVANPFFSAIYRGLEDIAWDAGYVVLAGTPTVPPTVARRSCAR